MNRVRREMTDDLLLGVEQQMTPSSSCWREEERRIFW